MICFGLGSKGRDFICLDKMCMMCHSMLIFRKNQRQNKEALRLLISVRTHTPVIYDIYLLRFGIKQYVVQSNYDVASETRNCAHTLRTKAVNILSNEHFCKVLLA